MACGTSGSKEENNFQERGDPIWENEKQLCNCSEMTSCIKGAEGLGVVDLFEVAGVGRFGTMPDQVLRGFSDMLKVWMVE